MFRAKTTKTSANVLFPIQRFWPSRIQPPFTWSAEWHNKNLYRMRWDTKTRKKVIKKKKRRWKSSQEINLCCGCSQRTCITSIIRLSQSLHKKLCFGSYILGHLREAYINTTFPIPIEWLERREYLTQQATVFNCAKEGKYFSFCTSDPHKAVLDSPEKLTKNHVLSTKPYTKKYPETK